MWAGLMLFYTLCTGSEGMTELHMESTGIRPIVIEEIRALAERHQIETVILFGSRARGDYRRTSDIDLAVRGGNFAAFALDVDEETSTLLKFDFVDLTRPVQPALRE